MYKKQDLITQTEEVQIVKGGRSELHFIMKYGDTYFNIYGHGYSKTAEEGFISIEINSNASWHIKTTQAGLNVLRIAVKEVLILKFIMRKIWVIMREMPLLNFYAET